MSLPRFFVEDQVISAEQDPQFALQLTVDDLKHFKVLRLRPGEHIAVIDAESDYFECEIISLDELPVVRISSHATIKEPSFSVTLFQGVPKGDKMESIIRHAIEVGVDGVVPVEFSRSVVKLKGERGLSKQRRWSSIAKSAAMQAGRTLIPKVSSSCNMHDACDQLGLFDEVILFWEEAAQGSCESGAISSAKSDKLDTQATKKVAVVVGPEGGITEEEVALIKSANPNTRIKSLGNNILRTETAGIVGSALVIYELGGLGNVK